MTKPWWATGAWVGPSHLGPAVCAPLGDVAASWRVTTVEVAMSGSPGSIVLNAAALEDDADIDALEAVFEGAVGGREKPARIISLVWDSWLGRAPTGRGSARSAAAVGLARNWALRLAPAATTVNTIALPAGFPGAPPPPAAPVQVAAGIEDLAHVVRFFGHPDNDYIIGQL